MKSCNFIENENTENMFFVDASGHGLGVAHIIVNCLSKNSNQNYVDFYSARVLDDSGSTTISRVIQAIYWAIENDVDIINMSFGAIPCSEALKIAIHDAYDAGILLIAASGNNNVVEYPAKYEEVISVGSIGPDMNLSEFCANDENIDVLAPGECIEVRSHFGKTEVKV